MAEKVSIEVEIKNANGMHMRPAMQFVDTASRFASKINVSNDKINVDGKSIMHMAMLAAAAGTKLKVTAEGVDAQAATDALKELIEVRMFDEPAWLQKE
ncbi:MAG: HPr family phosphocarrier protein [Planctomycetaceae bacterium]|nr:HPr family phosphocarrier protein [Planctomycetaceae bacterium]